MTKRLEGKVALITGAGQGVGQGIAFALANEGAHIAATGRTLEKCEATRAEIERRGGRAIAIACDVKHPDDLARAVETTVAELGTIDILVNNAHEVPLGTLLDMTAERFQAGWESGPLATFRLMKLCYPHVEGGGVIVNLGSTAAKRWDMTGYGAYAATKEEIRSLTKAAASEWGPVGIRVNAVLPHATSPALAWWMDANPDEAEAFQATIPMRRVGECEEDIGAFVAMLCADDARYVSGQSIAIDGGQAYMG